MRKQQEMKIQKKEEEIYKPIVIFDGDQESISPKKLES